MKKLGMLGIIGGAALLTAAPFSLQWSQDEVSLRALMPEQAGLCSRSGWSGAAVCPAVDPSMDARSIRHRL